MTIQVLDLIGTPTLSKDTFEDIFADAQVTVTLWRQIQCANLATPTPIVLKKLTCSDMEQTPQVGTLQAPYS